MEKIQEKYRNSVFQLICIRGIYDPFRPYLAPTDQRVRGTGFVVDIERGVIVTNAHVVANAFSIIGRTPLLGKRDLQFDLLSICQDRDLALVLIRPDDRIRLINAAPGPLNMPFGDSMASRQTDQVLAIGYPLGQESIKFTTGVISGFQARIDEENTSMSDLERDEDHPSYLVTTSPINPGNSGGPLVNEKGEVIGIVNAGAMWAQNIGYAIGSRNLLAIYPRMMSSYPTFAPGQNPDVVQLPKMSFNWNRTNQALINKFGIPGENAIYVSCTFPDSVLQPMEKGDLIRSLSYPDCFSNHQKDNKFYDVTQYSDFLLSANPNSNPNSNSNSNKTDDQLQTIVTFDDYGDIKINRPYERTLELKEVFDTIPIGTKLRFLIDRDQQSYYLDADYIPIDAYVTRFVYPRFETPDFVIFAGICISPLTLNHVERNSDLLPEIKGKKRYRPHLVVAQVFPETSIYQMNLLKEGSIINRIQGQKVQTMDDLRQILQSLTNEDILTIEDKNGGLFAIKVGQAIEEDRAVMEKFKITHDYIFDR